MAGDEDQVDIKTEPGEGKQEKVEKKDQEAPVITMDIPTDPQCYCGQQRDFKEPDFQCSACYKWFHLKCISFNIGKALPFMTSYHFMCKNCNAAREEVFSRKQANFAVMCQTALANLTFQHNGQLFFSNEKDVIPFLEQHWELLTTQPRKTNKSWHANIHKTLTSSELFKTKEENGELKVCLANTDLAKMGPSYDRFRALASHLKTDISKLGIPGGSRKRKAVGPGLGLAAGVGVGELGTGPLSKRRGPEEGRTRLSQFGFPLEHPYNRDGYRYVLVEPDPHVPGRQVWDECEHTAGKPIPSFFYRVCLGPKVLLSTHDRAHQLKLNEPQMSVTGEKGYCMVRATHGVSRGTWYFEVAITDQPEGSHARIGWSQPLGNLQAPCGFDKFSYSWRSRLGTVFHESRGKHYAEDGYQLDDVIGCLIHLPDQSELGVLPHGPKPISEVLPDNLKEKTLIKFKNNYYFEEKDEVSKMEKELKPLPKSKIMFFKNGVCQGVAFENIHAGLYFPAFSLYKSVTLTANFGPDFKYPPKDTPNWRPMSDRVHDLEVEQTVSDMLHLVDKGDQIEQMLLF